MGCAKVSCYKMRLAEVGWHLHRYPAYGLVYAALEVLALPAVPLTMTAGLLFGVAPGVCVVSVASTAAATVSFIIARYAGGVKELSICMSFIFMQHLHCHVWTAM